MAKILPKPGSYQGRRIAPVVIKQEESGAVGVYISYELVNAEVQYSGVDKVWIIKKDGTPQKAALDNLRKMFPGWESADPFDLQEIPLNDGAPEFRLDDCEHGSYTPKPTDENPNPEPVSTFDVGWFNPLEGGSGRRMPEPMSNDERKSFIAKNGAKLRALLGGKSSSPKAPAATTKAAVAPPRSSSPPAPGGGRKSTAAVKRTSTESEVWDAVVAKYPEETKEGQDAAFLWDKVSEMFPDYDLMKGDRPTITEWGAIADALEV